MSTHHDPLFLIDLVLADPAEGISMNKLNSETRRYLDSLQELARWRKYTDLSFVISGTKDGVICTFSVQPSAQTHLEAGIANANMGWLMNEVMQEKRQWVEELQNLPMAMLSQRAIQAAASTIPFRNKATFMGRPINPDAALPNEVGKILKNFRKSKLRGNVETHPWQLELAGFDGYNWGLAVSIRARPMRRTYGVLLNLLGLIPNQLANKCTLQLHYSSVSEKDQQYIDRACQQGSQISAQVFIGQQDNRPSVAHIQTLHRPVISQTKGPSLALDKELLRPVDN